MPKLRQRVTNWWPFLLLTAWGFPLITPLLRWTAVTCTHDGHLHYHRVAAMRHAWENGLFFTRWLPDLAFGYGYPFFVYREPLPLYAVLGPHLLGLPLPAATNLFYIITILACGWFMFLWVRDILGIWAGLVGGVAYMAAPYVLVDALIRGNSPESAALPLFPLLLWAGRRWLLGGGARWFGTAVLGLILLAFSHNISLLIFTPTLGVYLLALAWLHQLSWRLWLTRLALLFGLGLGTTIFYTGGALLEINNVTLEQSTTTRNNDFRFNFTSPAEILAPVPPEDPSLLNPPLPFRLGWLPLGLAILGVGLTIFWWKRSPNEVQWHVVLMMAATAVFLFMSLPVSRFIWEGLPLIDFVQFPWRFVGRTALPLAFLAGVPFAFFQRGGAEAQRGGWALVGVALAVGLLVLEAVPTVYPNICGEEPFPTINTVHQYERETGLVGVDPEGSYFPRTVEERPSGSPLEADYLANETPARLDTAVFPPGTTVEFVNYNPLGVTAQINSSEPFTARYLSFDFPGWVALVDGRSVPITPEDPSGLITFPVPAGSHSILVRWQSTPTRTVLLGLSLFSLAGVLVVGLILVKTESSLFSNHYSVFSKRSLNTGYGSLVTDYWPLITVSLLLIAGKLILDNTESPLRRMAGPDVANTAVLQAAELRLEGYNLSRTAVPSGGLFDIDLAWTATDFPQAQYQSNVWLAGPGGLVWSDLETFRPRLYEDAPDTRAWQPGQWAWDSREVAILRGTPPGRYDIVLMLFDLATLQPATLLAANGAVLGPTAVLGQITVTEPEPTGATTDMLGQIEGISLLEFRQDRAAAVPGDVVLLTFFWQRPSDVPSSENFSLELRTASEELAFAWEKPFTLPNYPPVEWPVQTTVRGQHLLRLPAGLSSGSYRFVADGLMLGEIEVTAPDRVFEAVEMETAVNATFTHNNQPLITLVGLTQSPVSNLQLPISLLWRAEAETSTSYRVFIHVVDGDGQILAQADGEPANWTRPTTGWVPGEYILDSHTLTLPPDLPDDAGLRIGLYNPTTNRRLATGTEDFVTIPLQ